jgi:hypothetical protein
MGRIRKVATPGSYRLANKTKEKGKEKGKETEKEKRKRKRNGKPKAKGRPSLNAKKASARKGNYRTRYTPDDLLRAFNLVKDEGWTASRAAKECGVPRITLVDKLQGTHKTGQVGRPTVLNKIEEEVLVEMIVLMGQYNYPLTKRHLRDMVKAYLDKHRDTRFKDNRPGRHWVEGFVRRHKDKVVIRTPNNIRRSRAAVSPDDIREYFANLKREIEGVPPSNIFNYDETCMRDDPGAKQCLFKKGVRYPEQVKDHSKTAFSTIFCICGDGNLTPSMTVYKSPSGNFYDTWATGAPPGSVFTANKSGWFTMREFETFFEKVFLKYIEGRIPKEDVKVLIGDNLGAHISPTVMEKCKEHNIR